MVYPGMCRVVYTRVCTLLPYPGGTIPSMIPFLIPRKYYTQHDSLSLYPSGRHTGLYTFPTPSGRHAGLYTPPYPQGGMLGYMSPYVHPSGRHAGLCTPPYVHPSGRHMVGIHPMVHPQGGIWWYIPYGTPFREAYTEIIPYVHSSGRHIWEDTPMYTRRGGI